MLRDCSGIGGRASAAALLVASCTDELRKRLAEAFADSPAGLRAFLAQRSSLLASIAAGQADSVRRLHRGSNAADAVRDKLRGQARRLIDAASDAVFGAAARAQVAADSAAG